MTNAQIREIRVNNQGNWYIATRTGEVPTWDSTPKAEPNTVLYVDAIIKNVGGSQSPSDTYKGSVELYPVGYSENTALATTPELQVYGSWNFNIPATADFMTVRVRGYDGNGTPTDTISFKVMRAPETPPPEEPPTEPPPTNHSLAARVPMLGNSVLVQFYLRKLRDKVFSKELHKKLHPLI